MIRRVYSDLPNFKNLDFHNGLNVLLAEKSMQATNKHTRNRAGKSSLIELIHFLLAADCKKDSIFRNDSLREANFGMELDLAETFVRVERSGAKPTPLMVAGDATSWLIAPEEKRGGSFMSNENWKTNLGKLMFGLNPHDESWGPTFRSLIKYFVRRDRDGGMEAPMKTSEKQQIVDQQVNISFLLGLDWAVPREWQSVRDRERSLEQIRKGMNEGAFGKVIGTASQLKSELIVAQDKTKRLAKALSSFKVLDQYHELEREASRITGQLAQLADENVVDRRYIAELEAASVIEASAAPQDFQSLYREVGIALPELVKKRFDEAAAFHESIVKNRRAYLDSEINAARRRIEERDQAKSKLDPRRSEVMGILQSSGALNQFAAMQAELTKAEADEVSLRHRYDSAESLETGDLKLKVERATLLERLRREYAEQETIIQDAVLTFREISTQLYQEDGAGTITITPTENGPFFDPHIPGDKSKGVNNMRIFCFDMMLMLLSLRRGRSPGFLIHDSHLFDGVDERQKGTALAVGAALAEANGFQYIVTMNTDDVPREVPSGFHFDDHVLPVRLTDASEDGGLFGLRFE